MCQLRSHQEKRTPSKWFNLQDVGTMYRGMARLKGQTRNGEALGTDYSGKPFPPLGFRGQMEKKRKDGAHHKGLWRDEPCWR